MKKLIVRWTQVYENVVEVPENCTPDNWEEFMDYFDFNANVDGAEGQVDTFEILNVRED